MQRFVDASRTTAPVAGRASAILGLDSVEVAGRDVAIAGDGSFAPDVPVVLGIDTIPIVARDVAGHARNGHRSRIAATFLPEGAVDLQAATLAVTDEVVAAVRASLATGLADLDLAAAIGARSPMTVDQSCTTRSDTIEHGALEVELAIDADAELELSIRVPDLRVAFTGGCDGLLQENPVVGTIEANVEIDSRLWPGDGQVCIRSFDHEPAHVRLESIGFDVWEAGGVGRNLAAEWSTAGRDWEITEQLRSAIVAEADAVIGKVADEVTAFEDRSVTTVQGVPVAVHFCLTDLRSEGGVPRVVLGASTRGPGGRESPGAPLVDGALIAAPGGELLVHPNLVAQLLHSAWSAGGLSTDALEPLPFALIAQMLPEIVGMHPRDAEVRVLVDGELPPVVQASAAGSGDLAVTMGDLTVVLECEGDPLFRLGTRLDLQVDLVPAASGALRPVVTAAASAHLLAELVDVDDAVLEDLVAERVEQAAPTLLGETIVTLPRLGAGGAGS